jgi:hypothetical protein
MRRRRRSYRGLRKRRFHGGAHRGTATLLSTGKHMITGRNRSVVGASPRTDGGGTRGARRMHIRKRVIVGSRGSFCALGAGRLRARRRVIAGKRWDDLDYC